MQKTKLFVLLAAVGALVAGCETTPGNAYRSDVYNAGQVNQMQDVWAIQIVAINPAQVVVPTTNYSDVARITGTVLGALAGVALGGHGDRAIAGGIAGGALGNTAANALTKNEGKTTVPGVQIIFRLPNGALKQSSQVGSLCEFKLGDAILVQTDSNGARVQPNNPLGCGTPQNQPTRF